MIHPARENVHIEVLIVGAGPTGLALAGSLAQAGISFRIIDKNDHRSTQSKALGVQAGTLEALAQVLGPEISAQMVSQGFRAQAAFIHLDERPELKVDLSQIPSLYPYILILEQSETEHILEEKLESFGARVERETEVVALEFGTESVRCEIRNRSGQEKWNARYVVGCDGAHSIIRKSCGIPFEGGTYEGDFILGDIKVDWPWEYGTIRTFISDKGALACFPMRGEQRYRFILIPNMKNPLARTEVDLTEFQAIASALTPKPIRLSEPIWLTRFRVHHRITETFRKGPVFLAGDAAHIHSPAGGQGMNTGIQDALNLGHKLALVLRGEAAPDLLDQYEAERKPVAKQVLRGTDFVFRAAIQQGHPFFRFLRNTLLPGLIGSTLVQRKVVTAISEVKVARQDITRRTRS